MKNYQRSIELYVKNSHPAQCITSKNIFFYLFLFLMVCAKGFGLDSGDWLYYALAIIAIPIWIGHMVISHWTAKTFWYSMFLLSIFFLSVLVNGKIGILLSAMAMVAVKDIDRESFMKVILKCWFWCMAIMMLLVFGGIVPDKVVSISSKTYHTMGYGHGNLFHASFTVLIILYLYKRKSKVTFLEILLILAANCVIYQYSASRSGLIIGVLASFLFYIFKYIGKNKKLKKITMAALCMGMLLIVAASFILPQIYVHEKWRCNEPVYILNRALTGRIWHSKTVLVMDSVRLLGKSGELAAFIDNAYVFLLMKCGIAVFAVFFILYVVAVKSMLSRKDDYGILIVFLFVLYGFVEAFFVNSFINFSLLIVGDEVMYALQKEKSCKCVSGR